MDNRAFVSGQISLFAWHEGKRLAPGSRNAMLGIAHVIGNRVEGGWYNGDWLKILEEAPVHSASNRDEMQDSSLPDIWDKDFRWLHDRVEQIYDRTLTDTITRSAGTLEVGGKEQPRPGFYYANLNNMTREWFVKTIAKDPDNHPRTAECMPLVFFG